jgi:cystathionine beta-lyase
MHFGSAALRERFRARVPDRLLGKVNRFGIEATIAAWADCGGWFQAAMQILKRNREHVTQYLRKLPRVGYHQPEAGYLAWLDCRALDLPAPPHAFFLERARVALNDGAEFGMPGAGHVRLNFATSQTILDAVLGRMADALARQERIVTELPQN